MQMPNLTLEPDIAVPSADNLRAGMQPITVDRCFGWLHVPAASISAKTAVLLCSALGDEGLTAHGQFRRLAVSLAMAGYPTLRFDYAGTGDSCDMDLASDVWTTWRKSVHIAADWLRDITAAERIVFCGLRLGALLAAEAAHERDDTAALVLLAPVARGRTFIRQLEVEAKLAAKRPSRALVLDASPLSQTSVQTIAAAELMRVPPPIGCPTIIFNQSASTVLNHCSDEWKSRGVCVDQASFSGLEPLLRPRIMVHERPADFACVTEWLHRMAPALPAGFIQATGPVLLTGQSWRETPLRFGPECRLFGVLCQPHDEVASQVVLIVNSGGDPRCGANRSGTVMARQLAASGIASLRIDFAGLGDSVAQDDGQTHVFETDRRPEVSAAFDALTTLGYTQLTLYGLCSGAYHAFWAAAADERVETLVMVNLPTFEWQASTDIASFSVYEVSVGTRAKLVWSSATWRRLLKGELRIQSQIMALGRKTATWVLGRIGKVQLVVHPMTAAQTAMTEISRRTRTLILMSPNELGLVAMAQEFGPDRKLPSVTLHVLPNLDHTVSDPAMLCQLTKMIIDFIKSSNLDGKTL